MFRFCSFYSQIWTHTTPPEETPYKCGRNVEIIHIIRTPQQLKALKVPVISEIFVHSEGLVDVLQSFVLIELEKKKIEQ